MLLRQGPDGLNFGCTCADNSIFSIIEPCRPFVLNFCFQRRRIAQKLFHPFIVIGYRLNQFLALSRPNNRGVNRESFFKVVNPENINAGKWFCDVCNRASTHALLPVPFDRLSDLELARGTFVLFPNMIGVDWFIRRIETNISKTLLNAAANNWPFAAKITRMRPVENDCWIVDRYFCCRVNFVSSCLDMLIFKMSLPNQFHFFSVGASPVTSFSLHFLHSNPSVPHGADFQYGGRYTLPLHWLTVSPYVARPR
jgi:hypothetical protein